MERILAATEEAIDTDNFLSFTFRDEDFHHALVQASDNMYLYDAWSRIYLRCNLYTRFFDRLYTRKTPLKSGTLAEHTAIFNALRHRYGTGRFAGKEALQGCTLVCNQFITCLKSSSDILRNQHLALLWSTFPLWHKKT